MEKNRQVQLIFLTAGIDACKISCFITSIMRPNKPSLTNPTCLCSLHYVRSNTIKESCRDKFRQEQNHSQEIMMSWEAADIFYWKCDRKIIQ